MGIMNKLQNLLKLRPNAWKSDSHLSDKQIKRSDVHLVTPAENKQNIVNSQLVSKSSDWTEVDLEVPDKDDHVHLPNPKLSIIFSSSENVTPTPPPRKHKKNFREKLEAVAKQAFQSNKKPVEEQLCVKKTINYKCPLCDKDEANHNRNHHHHHNHEKQDGPRNRRETGKDMIKIRGKPGGEKRKKNLSVISLPNYDELKLTVAQLDNKQKGSDPLTANLKDKNSLTMFQNDNKKPLAGSTGKLDSYITRCRSFGSLLPQQFKKLKVRKAPADIESDDSFGALEDWDLGLIEHYNPKNESLPRSKKEEKSNEEIISDLESLIVKEEDIPQPPKPPVRRSESLVRKISREGAQSAQNLRANIRDSGNLTPPPSPVPKQQEERLFIQNLPTEEDGHVEHSSLIKILEQFSIKDKQQKAEDENKNKTEDMFVSKTLTNNNVSAVDQLAIKRTIDSIEDFINAEKVNTNKDLTFRSIDGTVIS